MGRDTAVRSGSARHSGPAEPEWRIGDIVEGWATSPERMRDALRKLSARVTERHLVRPGTSELSGIAQELSGLRGPWEKEPAFDYFRSHVELLDAAFRHGLDALIAEPRTGAARELVELLRAVATDGAVTVGRSTALHTLAGQVLSLCDRDAAAAEFAHVRREAHAELIRFYYRDSGALTYYGEGELTAISREAGREIVRSIAPLRVRPSERRTGVGLSVDPAFFRIYGAWLYFYAQQLSDLDFTIFLCGQADEIAEAVSDADAVGQALGRLNRSGAPTNVQLYHVPVPLFVGRAKTFYACARFFAAEIMLERYPNVYLMDADLSLADNPAAYFEAIRDVAFGVPETTNGVRLSPWRRFAAGNVALNRRVLDTPVLEALHTYTAHGLRHGADWMLDQNALTYAVEQDGGRTFTALNGFSRPFVTSRFMATWEANFRRARR